MNEGEIVEQQNNLQEVFNWLEKLKLALKPVEAVPVLPHLDVGLQQPEKFYDYIRGDEGELFPVLREGQLHGVEALLATGAGVLPTAWMAYVLATAYHETARNMLGVREGLNVSDAWRRKNLKYYPWYGRGLVQLTWEHNYAHATDELHRMGYADIDLIARPDQALDLDVSCLVIVHGMRDGWFTGKKLRDYIPATPTLDHFKHARRIVNGCDKDQLIAGYAMEFYKALQLGVWQ